MNITLYDNNNLAGLTSGYQITISVPSSASEILVYNHATVLQGITRRHVYVTQDNPMGILSAHILEESGSNSNRKFLVGYSLDGGSTWNSTGVEVEIDGTGLHVGSPTLLPSDFSGSIILRLEGSGGSPDNIDMSAVTFDIIETVS